MARPAICCWALLSALQALSVLAVRPERAWMAENQPFREEDTELQSALDDLEAASLPEPEDQIVSQVQESGKVKRAKRKNTGAAEKEKKARNKLKGAEAPQYREGGGCPENYVVIGTAKACADAAKSIDVAKFSVIPASETTSVFPSGCSLERIPSMRRVYFREHAEDPQRETGAGVISDPQRQQRIRSIQPLCEGCTGGYYLENNECKAYGGTCANGQLTDQSSRTQNDHCGSCDDNYNLKNKECKAKKNNKQGKAKKKKKNKKK